MAEDEGGETMTTILSPGSLYIAGGHMMTTDTFKSLSAINSRDKRLENQSYKLGEVGHFGLDITLPEELDIDENAMSVFIPFADGNSRDGVGDVTEVVGLDLSRHRKNPCCLFDHGKKVEIPVGLAEDPDTGAYSVVIDPVARTAGGRVWFYQGKKALDRPDLRREAEYEHAVYCEQLFDMLAKRFIRGGSFGYQVKRAQPIQPDYMTGTPQGQHLLETLLLEFGPTVLPANADTVRKALCLGSCCGKPLSPVLVKSLSACCPEGTKTVVGFADVAEGKALFNSMKDAANELQSIRNDLASGHADRHALASRCDAVGEWVAKNGKSTGISAKLLTEATQLHDKIMGGSGNMFHRIEFTKSLADEIQRIAAGLECTIRPMSDGVRVSVRRPKQDAENLDSVSNKLRGQGYRTTYDEHGNLYVRNKSQIPGDLEQTKTVVGFSDVAKGKALEKFGKARKDQLRESTARALERDKENIEAAKRNLERALSQNDAVTAKRSQMEIDRVTPKVAKREAELAAMDRAIAEQGHSANWSSFKSLGKSQIPGDLDWLREEQAETEHKGRIKSLRAKYKSDYTAAPDELLLEQQPLGDWLLVYLRTNQLVSGGTRHDSREEAEKYARRRKLKIVRVEEKSLGKSTPVPLRSVRDHDSIPPADWKPGAGAGGEAGEETQMHARGEGLKGLRGKYKARRLDDRETVKITKSERGWEILAADGLPMGHPFESKAEATAYAKTRPEWKLGKSFGQKRLNVEFFPDRTQARQFADDLTRRGCKVSRFTQGTSGWEVWFDTSCGVTEGEVEYGDYSARSRVYDDDRGLAYRGPAMKALIKIVNPGGSKFSKGQVVTESELNEEVRRLESQYPEHPFDLRSNNYAHLRPPTFVPMGEKPAMKGLGGSHVCEFVLKKPDGRSGECGKLAAWSVSSLGGDPRFYCEQHADDPKFRNYRKVPLGKSQAMRPEEEDYRSIETGDSPLKSKSLDLRRKYVQPKSLRRRVRRSSPGSSIVHVRGKDISEVEKMCHGMGLKMERRGNAGGLEKLRLTGDDGAIDRVARDYGRKMKKSLSGLRAKYKELD